MRRSILLILTLALAAASPVAAGMFERTPIAPESGIEVLTRDVAQAQTGRALLANPFATVTISHVDVYDRFPHVEARDFQIVSDPRWNRLIFGERGRGVHAYDGRGPGAIALAQPRGMAVDERDRVYVADTGNDRIVVLQARTEFAVMSLEPVAVIGGLSGPYGVAYSDGGTPFHEGDDRLYVADTGRNRVVAYALEAAGAREVAVLGELGSGDQRFGGPMAIAVGRTEAGHTRDVYVADAHNRRIVRLRDEGAALAWAGEVRHDADLLTSLDADRWGNVYAAAPRQNTVQKFSANLEPLAIRREGLDHPRAFHVPFASVRDHRAGTLARVGQPSGVTVGDWSATSGIAKWKLGVELSGLEIVADGAPAARFQLGDRATVTFEVIDLANARRLARRTTVPLDAGTHTLALFPDGVPETAAAADLMVRLTAISSYPEGPSHAVQTRLRLNGSGPGAVPSRAVLFGNSPNPAAPVTRIAFLLPATPTGRVGLSVIDAQGRRVRTLHGEFAAGLNEVMWDGTDDRGRALEAGVYFSRLDIGEAHFAERMVLVR